MAYKIAFIGFDERQTRIYFSELAAVNADQVYRFDPRAGRIVLRDGTEIFRFSPAFGFLTGRHFDQVILADDRRRRAYVRRWPELAALERCMARSVVPEDFRLCIYDLDAEVNSG